MASQITIDVLDERTQEHKRRLDCHDKDITDIHNRITDEIKQKVQENKAWILVILNIALTILLHFLK